MTIGKGAGSALAAKLLAKPQIKGDLRRLKQIMEIGEVMKSDASIHAGPHPAQPSEERTPAPTRVRDTDVEPVATSSANQITPPHANGHAKHKGAHS
jgi:hypothetical protein